MPILSALLCLFLLVAGGAILALTANQLPAQVASHFGAGGVANGFMARSDYLLFMLAMTLGVPLSIALFTVLVPWLVPADKLRMPHREYWLAPERRQATMAALATSGLGMASIVAAFLIAVHLLVIAANRQTPPHLDSATLWTLVGALVVASVFWQFLRWRRFKVPR
ncbi:MAG: DUF1648 domain-containing protein [Casimicrobiaceae bacterium]